MPQKRAYRHISDDERRQMEQLRKAGWSDAEIGRELGRVRQVVCRVLGPSGYPPGPVPAATPSEVAKMAVKEKMSDEEIAGKLERSTRWVGRLRNRGGIKYPPGGKPSQKR